MAEQSSNNVLHPYRKRKFFFELAEQLGEEPPAFAQPRRASRAATSGAAVAKSAQDSSEQSKHVSANSSHDANRKDTDENAASTHTVSSSQGASQSLDEAESSFDSIVFDGSVGGGSLLLHTLPSQGSFFESTPDSGYLVPSATTVASPATATPTRSRAATHHHRHHHHSNSPHAQTRHRSRSSHDSPSSPSNSHSKRSMMPPRSSIAPTTSSRSRVRPRPTELVARNTHDSESTTNSDELVDYFDADRMCELSPCWLQRQATQCRVHTDAVACPTLLFCLQVMDEFIARNTHARQERWRVALCTLARCVFVARWDAHVLNTGSSRFEIKLSDYVARKATLPGVAYDVWCVINVYWTTYQTHYVHDETLQLDNDAFGRSDDDDRTTLFSCVWRTMHALLHVYGLRASEAARVASDVAAEHGASSSISDVLSSKALAAVVSNAPHDAPVRFGVAYLEQLRTSSSRSSRSLRPSSLERHVISQHEWKVAVKAFEIHLHKWDARVQVFPCGAFSRGAAFGSTIDLLVALPADAPAAPVSASASTPSRRVPRKQHASQRHDDVVHALATAKIVEHASEHRVASTRSLFVVPYKCVLLVLDLKVYAPPQSWFALVYFTGPQSFVRTFFAAMLEQPLHGVCGPSSSENSDVSFDAVFAAALDKFGAPALARLDSEQSVFALAGRAYVAPCGRV